jgi:hypothetical protein
VPLWSIEKSQLLPRDTFCPDAMDDLQHEALTLVSVEVPPGAVTVVSFPGMVCWRMMSANAIFHKCYPEPTHVCRRRLRISRRCGSVGVDPHHESIAISDKWMVEDSTYHSRGLRRSSGKRRDDRFCSLSASNGGVLGRGRILSRAGN